MKPAVLTGEHFMTGDVACAEGALAIGADGKKPRAHLGHQLCNQQ